MRDLDPTPPVPGGLIVTFVSPGGLALEPFADGYALMRVVAGHLDDAGDPLEEPERRQRSDDVRRRVGQPGRPTHGRRAQRPPDAQDHRHERQLPRTPIARPRCRR